MCTWASAKSRGSSIATPPPFTTMLNRCCWASLFAYAPDHVIDNMYITTLAVELVVEPEAGHGPVAQIRYPCIGFWKLRLWFCSERRELSRIVLPRNGIHGIAFALRLYLVPCRVLWCSIRLRLSLFWFWRIYVLCIDIQPLLCH